MHPGYGSSITAGGVVGVIGSGKVDEMHNMLNGKVQTEDRAVIAVHKPFNTIIQNIKRTDVNVSMRHEA
jgi:type II secretory ATPase GspE/PulE/Tfp pilus assembly ATPase PilB-like protein